MKFFNRFRSFVLVSALCLTSVFSMPVLATEAEIASESRYNKEIESNRWENWPTGPQVYAESAIIMEASTGAILYAKSIDERHYPASITKIMTVLLALENLDMEEEVTFSHNAVFSVEAGSSSICRNKGEILTVEECLYAIMLESANDCANAIAEQVSGSVEAFAELMNQRAAELGCTNTNFVNPHGLPDENHYTTARDMALITQEAVKYERFRQISGASRYMLRATNKNDEQLPMSNHHYMISGNKTQKYLDDTVFAGKTGYTTAALNTLVTCATRSGMDLIVVTMKTQGTGVKGVPVFPDTASLLDFATKNFHKVNIAENEASFTIGQNGLFDAGSSVFGASVPLIEINPEGYVILPVGTDFFAASPRLEFHNSGDSRSIATLSYTYNGQNIGSTDLLLTSDDLQEFDFQKTTEEGNARPALSGPSQSLDEKGTKDTKLIRINLRIVGLAVCVPLLLFAAFLLARKIYQRFFQKDDWQL